MTDPNTIGSIHVKAIPKSETFQCQRLTLFCENYYFTKKITNLRRKLLICKEKNVGSKSTLLLCEENYYFTKKIAVHNVSTDMCLSRHSVGKQNLELSKHFILRT